MRVSMELGSTPYEEDCAQVGSDDYYDRARREVRAYIAQLIRVYGEPPDGVSLRCKSFPHDFGSYMEAQVAWNDDDEQQTAYAYRLEAGCARWDEQAIAALSIVNA